MLTALIGAFCGAYEDSFIATSSAVAAMGISGEGAEEKLLRNGTGNATFRNDLIDALFNLTDEQISEIIRRNGVIGVNFYPQFLDNNGVCGIDKLCEHIEYILAMNGENTAALGSDFDGVDCLPSGICGAGSMKDICKLLSTSGINDDIVKKIAFDNLYRVFYQTLNRKK